MFAPSTVAMAAIMGVVLWGSRCQEDFEGETCARENTAVGLTFLAVRAQVLAHTALLLATCKRLADAGVRVPRMGRARTAVALAAIPVPTFGAIALFMTLRQYRRVNRLLGALEAGERVPAAGFRPLRPSAW
ncbi:MAG: hypothetical protein AAF447_04595 [Myxococcota bacterium]